MINIKQAKKFFYDGSQILHKKDSKIQIIKLEEKKADFTFNSGKINLIVGEQIYKINQIEKDITKQLKNRNETEKYIKWKLKLENEEGFLTYRKLGTEIYSFFIDQRESTKIRKIFPKNLKSIKPFVFEIYDNIINRLKPFSILVIDYENITVFLSIGENSPVFMRRKIGLSDSEKEQEVVNTTKFVKKRYNIEINQLYSNLPFAFDNMILINENPFDLIL